MDYLKLWHLIYLDGFMLRFTQLIWFYILHNELSNDRQNTLYVLLILIWAVGSDLLYRRDLKIDLTQNVAKYIEI